MRSGVEASGVLPESGDPDPAKHCREQDDEEDGEGDVVEVHGSNYWIPEIAPQVAVMTLPVDILPSA